MHKLLARQLRRYCGGPEHVPEQMRALIAAVEEAYRQSDDDRAMLERSMEIVSEELAERSRLRDALAESQRAEHAMTKALSTLSATLESTTDGILVVDHEGALQHTNRRCIELWQVTPELQAGRDARAVFDHALRLLVDPERFRATVREFRARPDACGFGVIELRDGRTIEHYSMPQEIAGAIAGRVWSFRDITGRRQLEHQVRQAQKMEAVGRLAGGVSHDFNNLLTVILAECDLSLASPEHMTDQRRQSFVEIRHTADRAAALTRQLLMFSRVQVTRRVPLSLRDVVASVESMLRRLIGADVRLVICAGGDDGTVVADAGQLEQVVVNLAVNARDAMPDGGTLMIETETIVLDANAAARLELRAGTYAVLSVTDSGVGIAEDVRAHLFEPYFTTKEPGKGTGLGLATCYGIARQFGGGIEVSSRVGTGTTMRVYLPTTTSAVTAQPESYVAPARGGRETILLVEDDPRVRFVNERTLAAAGYRVFGASDGEEALKLLHENGEGVDLVLTDVVLPKFSGRVLAERARVVVPGVRVLFTSGYADDAKLREELVARGALLLPKPYGRDTLLRTVREVLDQPIYAGARAGA